MKEPWDILGVPTVSYSEELVETYIVKFCKKHSIKYWQDPIGDVWLNIQTAGQIKNIKTLVSAHMDHAGIAFTKGKTGEWVGGLPNSLVGADVKLFGGDTGTGTIESANGKRVTVKTQAISPEAGYLWFKDLPDGYEKRGDSIYAKSADNLISVAAILSAVQEKGIKSGSAVLFTRSEAHNEDGIDKIMNRHKLSKSTEIFSIDSIDANMSDGIRPGGGIVIRTGDRRNSYSENMIQKISRLAVSEMITYSIKGIGSGRGEGTIFNRNGYPVGSIAIPVENMYNRGPKELARPVPERVDVKDVFSLKKMVSSILNQ